MLQTKVKRPWATFSSPESRSLPTPVPDLVAMRAFHVYSRQALASTSPEAKDAMRQHLPPTSVSFLCWESPSCGHLQRI